MADSLNNKVPNLDTNTPDFDKILNDKSTIPMVVSPVSTSVSSTQLNGITPINPDNNGTYNLSKNDGKNKDSIEGNPTRRFTTVDEDIDQILNNEILSKDDVLNSISMENDDISNEIMKESQLLDTIDGVPLDNLNSSLTTVNNKIDTTSLLQKITDSGAASNLTTTGMKYLPTVKKTKAVKKIASQQPNKRPAFVVKLWQMMNDPSNSKYIRWVDPGDVIQVFDREQFMKDVLPKYFKHNNFASFVRQLNMYGWRKVQDPTAGSLIQSEEVWQFENKNFIRGREDLLDNIVRNKPSSHAEEEEYDIKSLMDQLEHMKRNQQLITEDLRRVRHDNELLWKENFLARERHKIQSDTLDKIMRFLASIYGNNTNNLIEQMHNNATGSELMEINPSGYAGKRYYNNNGNSNGNYHSNVNNMNSQNFNNSNANNNNMEMGMNMQNMDRNQNMNHNNNMNIPNSMTMTDQYSRRYQPQNQRYADYDSGNQVALQNRRYQNYEQDNNQTNGVFKSPDYRGNAIQSAPYYSSYGSPSPGNNSNNYNEIVNPKRRLMITNRSNGSVDQGTGIDSKARTPSSKSSRSPNEVRMKNLNYETASVGSVDSSIQEIHRGPENRNSSVQKNYVRQIPDFINTPRQFSDASQHNSLYDNTTNHSQDLKANDIANNLNLDHVPKRSSNIMGNIQDQLHRNENTLKQANSWLNKYGDQLDSNEIDLPENFEVDDFLQQPIDYSLHATPIDFNNIDGFINTETPLQTPTLSNAQLNIVTPSNGMIGENFDDQLLLNTNGTNASRNNKRSFQDAGNLNDDQNKNSNKKSRPF